MHLLDSVFGNTAKINDVTADEVDFILNSNKKIRVQQTMLDKIKKMKNLIKNEEDDKSADIVSEKVRKIVLLNTLSTILKQTSQSEENISKLEASGTSSVEQRFRKIIFLENLSKLSQSRSKVVNAKELSASEDSISTVGKQSQSSLFKTKNVRGKAIDNESLDGIDNDRKSRKIVFIENLLKKSRINELSHRRVLLLNSSVDSSVYEAASSISSELPFTSHERKTFSVPRVEKSTASRFDLPVSGTILTPSSDVKEFQFHEAVPKSSESSIGVQDAVTHSSESSFSEHEGASDSTMSSVVEQIITSLDNSGSGKIFFNRVPLKELSNRLSPMVKVRHNLPASVSPTVKITPVLITGVGGENSIGSDVERQRIIFF